MIQVKGICASEGIVMGKIVQARRGYTGLNRTVRTPEYERGLVQAAVHRAHEQLQELMEKAITKDDADIFLFQQLMLKDRGLMEEINLYIDAGAGAAAAVERASEIFSARIGDLEDEYMRERACDVRDGCRRLVHILDGGKGAMGLVLDEPCILAGSEIYPSDILGLDRTKLLGFVSAVGSANAHVAILARTFNIPAVVMAGAEFLKYCNGSLAVLDGTKGKLIINPSANVMSAYHKKQTSHEGERKALQKLIGKPSETKHGKSIKIKANTGQEADVHAAFANDATGVGLFRSEFLYMERESFPEEEDLFASYKNAVLAAKGKSVTIRTMDLGSDKSVSYLKIPVEDNPAMGYRAIRICLKQPDIFNLQLRAILRASAFGKVSILLPMITTTQQVHEALKHLETAKKQLDNENIPYAKDIAVGLMIETPAAVMASDLLAEIEGVSFFSIGTNDLTQYTLAVDRANGMIGDMYDAHNVSVLRMIQLVVNNAHAKGVKVSICGECAADHTLTALFIALGIDSLSVTPSAVLPLRKCIRNITQQDCEQALQKLKH